MIDSERAVFVFSVVTIAMWLGTLAWSLAPRRRGQRWFNVFVLIVASIAWWLGETSAIRLGKYEYSPYFASHLILPLGGPRNDTDLVFRGLRAIENAIGLPVLDPIAAKCATALNWNVPFPVVALEACLVFAFLRLSFFRLKNTTHNAALAAAAFSAVLMVTLAAVLDPVVSTHTWCGTGNDASGVGLTRFEVWHWFTSDAYIGHWFGVPTVNYTAWLVGMGTFSFLARLDDEGPSGIIRTYEHWYQYVWPATKLIGLLFLIEVPVKIILDLVVVRGGGSRAWEFGVIGALFAVCFGLVWKYGKIHPCPNREWVCASPLVVLLLCFLALLLEFRGELFAVWVVSFLITAVVAGLPFFFGWLSERRRVQLLGEPRINA
jgi:hypothetical protein